VGWVGVLLLHHQTTKTMNTYKLIAKTDSISDCDCCGKSNLKMTFLLENQETGHEGYYGRVCASKIMGSTKDEFSGILKNYSKKVADEFKIELKKLRADFMTTSNEEYLNLVKKLQLKYPQFKKRIYNKDLTVTQ